MSNIEYQWQPVRNVPKDRKVLLRRGDNIYHGKFQHYDAKGRAYFNLDAYGNTIFRRADFWCDLPESLKANPFDIPNMF